MEKLLTALGVRRHVELQLVFNRLLHAGGWTVFDLVKYLVSVRDELSATEMDKLRNTPAFPVEGLSTRQTPASLFEPTDELRKLKLPILDWGTVKWRSNSDEGASLLPLPSLILQGGDIWPLQPSSSSPSVSNATPRSRRSSHSLLIRQTSPSVPRRSSTSSPTFTRSTRICTSSLPLLAPLPLSQASEGRTPPHSSLRPARRLRTASALCSGSMSLRAVQGSRPSRSSRSCRIRRLRYSLRRSLPSRPGTRSLHGRFLRHV